MRQPKGAITLKAEAMAKRGASVKEIRTSLRLDGVGNPAIKIALSRMRERGHLKSVAQDKKRPRTYQLTLSVLINEKLIERAQAKGLYPPVYLKLLINNAVKTFG